MENGLPKVGVKAKLGRKTKVCLPAALEKAMCATKRCTSSGCMGLVARSLFFFLKDWELANLGFELPPDPGHMLC